MTSWKKYAWEKYDVVYGSHEWLDLWRTLFQYRVPLSLIFFLFLKTIEKLRFVLPFNICFILFLQTVHFSGSSHFFHRIPTFIDHPRPWCYSMTIVKKLHKIDVKQYKSHKNHIKMVQNVHIYNLFSTCSSIWG